MNQSEILDRKITDPKLFNTSAWNAKFLSCFIWFDEYYWINQEFILRTDIISN